MNRISTEEIFINVLIVVIALAIMFFTIAPRGYYTIKYNCHFNGCSTIHTDDYNISNGCISAKGVTVCSDYTIEK